jgi:CheY-like chemotaxis protein
LPVVVLEMRILVASSSTFRQRTYRDAVESLGHHVSVVSGGIECVARIGADRPDLLILEVPLAWGRAETVLQALQENQGEHEVPVILVATGMGSVDWFQLSRFRIENLLFRVPTAVDLAQAITGIVKSVDGKPKPRTPGLQEASLAQ